MYRKKAMAHLSNNVIRFLSKYLYVYGAVAIISAVCCVYGLRLTYKESSSLCIFLFLMLCPWGVQFSLLLLFIYPLAKRNRSSNIKTDRKYSRVMKRVIALTVVHTAMALSY